MSLCFYFACSERLKKFLVFVQGCVGHKRISLGTTLGVSGEAEER